MRRETVKHNKKKEDTLYSLPTNSKTHATLKEKIYHFMLKIFIF